jgi:hypothetical protein
MDAEKEEWDGPWKEALECLHLVFGLFWPDEAVEVDLGKGWTSLEQELQKLTPDSGSGLLRVDKLFELAARGRRRPGGRPDRECRAGLGEPGRSAALLACGHAPGGAWPLSSATARRTDRQSVLRPVDEGFNGQPGR